MQLYGVTKRDKTTCEYGCCGRKAARMHPGYVRNKKDRDRVKRALRKHARQEGKAEIDEALDTGQRSQIGSKDHERNLPHAHAPPRYDME